MSERGKDELELRGVTARTFHGEWGIGEKRQDLAPFVPRF